MAKKFKAIVRLQLEAGKANPAPPVGPALAGHGINIMAFCKEYNARTSNRQGEVLPAEITVYTDGSFTFFGDTSGAAPVFVLFGYLIALGIIAAIVGLIVLLVVRRDIGVAYVAIAGLICGIVSAIISAPIAAVVFGGVTGSGTDLLVAAFQQAGADLQTAVLQQGLISDPIDKTLTFFIVFVLLQTLSRRFVARFPQGEKALGLEAE